MKIGILTAGGDCPGLNAAIRGVGKTAILKYNMEVLGFSSGYSGLLEKDYRVLTERRLSGILTKGGTILGTSREKPFKDTDSGAAPEKIETILANYEDLDLDCVVCIGGNGTMKTAWQLQEKGINVIGLPKTIDNDIWGTDNTFGFDSAVNIATEAIDRLHTTANSHGRIMVVEVMGHHTGWLALHSGVAGGGDIILLPEIPFNEDVMVRYLENRNRRGKPYSIVVVAEGVKVPKGPSPARYIAKRIQKLTGQDTRETILGYIQRGGSPSPFDRILASELGAFAVELINDRKFGHMAAVAGQSIKAAPLEEVAGKIKYVEKDNSLIKHARGTDICFGDEF